MKSINGVWHGGDQSVALVMCNDNQDALIATFRASAVGSSVFHLPFDRLKQVCEQINHRSITIIKPATLFMLTSFAGAKSCALAAQGKREML